MQPETSAQSDDAIDRHIQKLVLPAKLREMSADSRIRKILFRWRREIEMEDRVNSAADKFIGGFFIVLAFALFLTAGYFCRQTILEQAPTLAVTVRYISLTLAFGAVCFAIGIFGVATTGWRVPGRPLYVIGWSCVAAFCLFVFAIIGVVPLAFIKF